VNSLNMVGKDTPAFGHPSKRGEGEIFHIFILGVKGFRAEAN